MLRQLNRPIYQVMMAVAILFMVVGAGMVLERVLAGETTLLTVAAKTDLRRQNTATVIAVLMILCGISTFMAALRWPLRPWVVVFTLSADVALAALWTLSYAWTWWIRRPVGPPLAGSVAWGFITFILIVLLNLPRRPPNGIEKPE